VLEWLTAERPVLAAPRGGLAEALGEGWPGLFPIEPSADGIVTAARALAEPGAWKEAVARVRPPTGRDGLEGWLDAHARIYHAAAAARTA
jgi:hypothetical protein